MVSRTQFGILLAVAAVLLLSSPEFGVAYLVGRLGVGVVVGYVIIKGYNGYKRGKATT